MIPALPALPRPTPTYVDLRKILDAAKAAARSEIGVQNMKAGAGIEHDPWPEMDELVKLLDQIEPGWEIAA